MTLKTCLALLLFAGLATSSCAHRDGATHDLVAWLDCEDCGTEELAAVARHGDAVVPSLAAALARGPSPARLERLRHSLDAGYDHHARIAQDRPDLRPGWSKDRYAAFYVDAFTMAYRLRAARALAAVPGARARDALADAARITQGELRRRVEELQHTAW